MLGSQGISKVDEVMESGGDVRLKWRGARGPEATAGSSVAPSRQGCCFCLRSPRNSTPQKTIVSALPVTSFTSHHSIDNPTSHIKVTQQTLSTVMDYSKLKVAELKELLKERGLSTTGLSKKQAIIDALEEDDAESGLPADQQEEEDDAEVEVELDVKTTTKSTRSSTKRKANSPTPAKQAKKPKPEPPAATAVDTPTGSGKPAAPVTDAQYAPAGASLDIPIDEGVSSSWHVFVDPDTGIIYDASLNQTNASNNNNKFYRVQVFIPCLPKRL